MWARKLPLYASCSRTESLRQSLPQPGESREVTLRSTRTLSRTGIPTAAPGCAIRTSLRSKPVTPRGISAGARRCVSDLSETVMTKAGVHRDAGLRSGSDRPSESAMVCRVYASGSIAWCGSTRGPSKPLSLSGAFLSGHFSTQVLRSLSGRAASYTSRLNQVLVTFTVIEFLPSRTRSVISRL